VSKSWANFDFWVNYPFKLASPVGFKRKLTQFLELDFLFWENNSVVLIFLNKIFQVPNPKYTFQLLQFCNNFNLISSIQSLSN